VSSQEAERIGLVNRVVADEDLLPAVYELATQIAGQPQEAVRAFRRAVYHSATMMLHAHLDMISSHMAVLFDTPEHGSRVQTLLGRLR
jgi:enoyl-CoA hydratase/carnithine racemase